MYYLKNAPATDKPAGATAETITESLLSDCITNSTLLEGFPPMGTPEEVASFCNLKPDAVRQLCREGKLRAVKFGTLWRVPRAWLVEYIISGGENNEQQHR